MQREDKRSIPDKIIAVADSIRATPSSEAKSKLISFINDLINKDFSTLVQLLYRIDVNEKKLKERLKQNEKSDAALIIADLIIERQLQKIATKKQYDSSEKSSRDNSW
ncbi:MAG: hypothetical protein ACRDE5_03990 [Ginsengibacter sp.]